MSSHRCNISASDLNGARLTPAALAEIMARAYVIDAVLDNVKVDPNGINLTMSFVSSMRLTGEQKQDFRDYLHSVLHD